MGRVAGRPEKRDSGPDSPDAGASTADWAVRPAGRRAAGRGDVLRRGVANELKRPDFRRFLSWYVEVRGATGEPRAFLRQETKGECDRGAGAGPKAQGGRGTKIQELRTDSAAMSLLRLLCP